MENEKKKKKMRKVVNSKFKYQKNEEIKNSKLAHRTKTAPLWIGGKKISRCRQNDDENSNHEDLIAGVDMKWIRGKQKRGENVFKPRSETLTL